MCKNWAFQIGILGAYLYLILAYWEAFKSKVSLFQKWVECVQVKGTFGRGVTDLREDGNVCVTSCNGEGYIVTCLTRIVKWCENPTGVGHGFSPQLS